MAISPHFYRLVLVVIFIRRWHCQRAPDACHGSSPASRLRVVGMHDSLYEFHRHHIFCCLWSIGYGICSHMLLYRFCRYVCGANWARNFNETGKAQFLHCFFHWRSRPFIGVTDDRTVSIELGGGRTPCFGRYLRKGLVKVRLEFMLELQYSEIA